VQAVLAPLAGDLLEGLSFCGLRGFFAGLLFCAWVDPVIQERKSLLCRLRASTTLILG